MNIPINCPKCKNPLCSYIDANPNFLTKKCKNHINHMFDCTAYISYGAPDKLCSISIRLDMTKQIDVTWYFSNNRCVVSGHSRGYDLPFFYPNLDHYDQMIIKAKTYLTFL